MSEERIWQHQFVAFKAGMLKERICHVLTYRKPLPIKSLTMTLITLILDGAILIWAVLYEKWETLDVGGCCIKQEFETTFSGRIDSGKMLSGRI